MKSQHYLIREDYKQDKGKKQRTWFGPHIAKEGSGLEPGVVYYYKYFRNCGSNSSPDCKKTIGFLVELDKFNQPTKVYKQTIAQKQGGRRITNKRRHTGKMMGKRRGTRTRVRTRTKTRTRTRTTFKTKTKKH